MADSRRKHSVEKNVAYRTGRKGRQRSRRRGAVVVKGNADPTYSKFKNIYYLLFFFLDVFAVVFAYASTKVEALRPFIVFPVLAAVAFLYLYKAHPTQQIGQGKEKDGKK